MKSILLIGDLNNTLSNIYKSLVDNYRVQICRVDLNEVEGLTKIVDQDLVLISMYGVGDFDKQILEYFKNLEFPMPVVFIGSLEECREYVGNYQTSNFAFLERPIKQKDLLLKCQEMLERSEGKRKLLEKDSVEKKKVLVVDDSGVFLRAMKSLLESKYEILLAKSGEKCLEVAAAEQPDLILLDYEMPGWDGRETLEQLRLNEETAKIPVIFLTGVSDKGHIIEVLKMQPQGYILKPVDGDELERKIEEVIE